MIPWPHQTRGVQEVINLTIDGERRICFTSPTGGGKSLVMQMLAEEFLKLDGKVVCYTNRKMLVEQLSKGLSEAGLYHGVRAAGYEDEREYPFQVSSIQTEHSRVTKKKIWNLHDANLVLVDEAHLQKEQSARTILDAHYQAGAVIVGITATPLGLGDIYDRLVIAGNMTELRACGALVPAMHYGADEPDLKAFKKLREGEDPSRAQQKSAMMTPTLFGRVWDWYGKLNPEQKPCVLFGPGVDEALWFAEQFKAKGVKAAHIDGNDVWIDGAFYKSDQVARDEVREGSKSGDIKVVTNRYVLREGVDWPWVEHIILAFVAGSLQTYIQTCGRGLRASSGKTQLIIQDHGGCWWRHGSINADREWTLDLTDAIACGFRADRMRAKKIAEPFRCPRCGRIWMKGTTCLTAHGGCGFELGNRRKSRPVVSTDGELREMVGDIYRPRRISNAPNGQALWEKMYWRSRTTKGDRTFRAAAALFAQEWGWPDPNWRFMPIEEKDWFRHVSEVPRERLR
jgi:superfamily II DNA or RNA helicase